MYCSHHKGEFEPDKTHSFTGGYGVKRNGHKACYPCCAWVDAEYLKKHGKGTLYFSHDSAPYGKVTNWPGSFSLPCTFKTGGHNWGITRYDVWFKFDGSWWHGVTYGDMTQICHVKRTKEVV